MNIAQPIIENKPSFSDVCLSVLLKPEISQRLGKLSYKRVFLARFLLTVGNPKGCNLGYVPLNEYLLVINSKNNSYHNNDHFHLFHSWHPLQATGGENEIWISYSLLRGMKSLIFMWGSSSLVGMDFPGGGSKIPFFLLKTWNISLCNWKLEYFGSHPALSIV